VPNYLLMQQKTDTDLYHISTTHAVIIRRL